MVLLVAVGITTQVILFCLKVAGVSHQSWWGVFGPVWIWLSFEIVTLIFIGCRALNKAGKRRQYQRKSRWGN